MRFALQASVWFALALAIATMLWVGGPFRFVDALRFSSSTWMPWALLTPVVFWLSRRFPIMRGRLVRSIPIHLAACVACAVAASWATSQMPANFLVLSGSRSLRPGAAPGSFEGGSFEGVAVGSGMFAGGQSQTLTVHGPVGAIGSGSDSVTFFSAGAVEARPILESVQTNIGKEPFVTHQGLPEAFSVSNEAGLVSVSAHPPRGAPPRMPWHMFLVPLAMRANVGLPIYLIIASAAHAMAFYRQAQKREQQALALVASRNQAKLDALRLQLQPHFLFNALNAIATLMHEDTDAADDLVGDLSNLLRVSLQTTAHEVTLTRELELLDHYLAIEQARLGDRLRVVRDIDPSAFGAYVPTLILQPLAENAVRHGFEPRLAPGTLTLQARRVGDMLRLAVSDDGVGFGPATTRAGRRGIGLANSEERLRTLHDDRAQLQVISLSEGGVRVEITLPFRLEPSPATQSEA